MQQTCASPWCSQTFEITETDQRFYAETGPVIAGTLHPLPLPDLCPGCRMQRRIAHRNFFHLCHRTCDLTGKRIISMYDESAPFPVYEMHAWWSDQWDALQYGRDVSFDRPFFEQLSELFSSVPRMSIMNTNCENTDFCNFSFQSKNCYLIGGNVGNEDCCYGHIVWQSKDCFDCLYVYRCSWCYECTDCVDCYGLAFSRACDNCSESYFLSECSGCTQCFGCTGLKNKQYHFFNEPLQKEEYERRLAEFDAGSRSLMRAAQAQGEQMVDDRIVKHLHGVNNENVTGDYLYNCQRVFDSFDAKNCQDCRFLATAESFSDCQDCNYCPAQSERCCECMAVSGQRIIGCHNVNSCNDMTHCQDCFFCRDCFGCEGLKNKQYCILNKQYSKEEYEALVPKIIERMRQRGEFGSFFPVPLSPFGYNQTMAQEYFPLTREEVKARGWRWVEEVDRSDQYMGADTPVPDSVRDASDDICNTIFRCAVTGKPFKIIPQELEYCRSRNLPLPDRCFDQRHKERMALRNPRKLWNRECLKCGKDIQTTYAPERPEIVYCEECYLASVY